MGRPISPGHVNHNVGSYVNAGILQNFADGAKSQLWGVALLAEVGEQNVFDPFIHQPQGGLGTVTVGKMSLFAGDSLFQKCWVGGGLQHFPVVICLQKHKLGAYYCIQYFFRNDAQVRHNTHFFCAGGNRIAYRFGSVVRNGKYVYAKVFQIQIGTCFDIAQIGGAYSAHFVSHGFPGAFICIYGNIVFAGQRSCAFNVVSVLVGNKDAADALWADAYIGERNFLRPQGDPAINENSVGFAAGNQRGISAAAAV